MVIPGDSEAIATVAAPGSRSIGMTMSAIDGSPFQFRLGSDCDERYKQKAAQTRGSSETVFVVKAARRRGDATPGFGGAGPG